MSETLSSGLTLIIPSLGDDNWSDSIRDNCFQPISEHGHTGSGDGLQIATGAIANLAVTAAKIASDAVTTAKILDANVTLAKLANIATDRLIGRDTASTGVPEALTVGGGVEFTGSGGIQRSALTGDVTASAGSAATTIANDAVTTDMILDSAVTTAKLDTGSVTTQKIQSATVTPQKLSATAMGTWVPTITYPGSSASQSIIEASYIEIFGVVFFELFFSVTLSGTTGITIKVTPPVAGTAHSSSVGMTCSMIINGLSAVGLWRLGGANEITIFQEYAGAIANGFFNVGIQGFYRKA